MRALPCDFGPATKDGRPRYELRELLGEGALGQVYLAVDRHLSEQDHPAFVSIKLLRGQERSVLERQQLVDEATKARRINHPNVARVLDRGVSARDEDFLLYEYVEGGDLARWARRRGGAVPIEEAARTRGWSTCGPCTPAPQSAVLRAAISTPLRHPHHPRRWRQQRRRWRRPITA